MKQLVLALLVLTLAAPVLAKNCKKGCPCGDSCISCEKMCRVDSAPRYAPPPAPSQTYAPADAVPSDAVRSYVKKDGTVVDGYRRSQANSTDADNWSTQGNINP